MKILIATMTCGEGHNAIARSIRDGFGSEHEVRIVNIYEHLGNRDWRGKSYIFFVKYFPRTITFFWNRLRKCKPEKRYRGYAMSGIKDAEKEMENLLNEFQPDAVICTHVQASNIFCWLKIHNRFQGKLYSVFFDYFTCPFWEGSVLCDAVFTPHEMTHPDLISRGFREEQLLPFGFCVNPKYEKEMKKSDAREALGIAANEFVVLSVNGGLGVGNVIGFVRKAVRARVKDLRLLVVCGRNEKIFRKVTRFVRRHKLSNVQVFGFVDNLEIMLSASDLFFCRGGGGAVSESLMRGVPFIVRERAVVQERLNGSMFSRYGVCRVMKRLSDAKKFIEQEAETCELNANDFTRFVKKGSVEKIVEYVQSQQKIHC